MDNRTKTIFKNSLLVAICTLLSKVIGLIRDIYVTSGFGATILTDIYFFSNDVIIIFFSCIGVALNTTFIPMLSDHINNKGKEERVKFVNLIVTCVSAFMIIVTFIGIIFSKYIIKIIAPGFAKQEYTYFVATNVMRIMFISLFLIALQNILTGVLHAHNNFFIPSIMTVFSNGFLILYLIIFNNKFGIWGLTVSTVIAYLIQVLLHLPCIKKIGYSYKVNLDFKNKEFRKMIRLMMPVFFGSSVIQINEMISKMIATTIQEGAVVVLGISQKLNNMVYHIVGATIVTIIYPKLARLISNQNNEEHSKLVIKSVKYMIIILTPIYVILSLLSFEVINILFNRGQFDYSAVKLTSYVLVYYVPGMIFLGVREILYKTFYSLKETKIPMKNSIIAVVVNIVLMLSLVKSRGIYAPPIAFSFSTFVATLSLIIDLNKHYKINIIKSVGSIILKVALASIGVYSLINLIKQMICFNINSKGRTFLFIFLIGIFGIIIYTLIMAVLNLKECKMLVKSSISKLKRKGN